GSDASRLCAALAAFLQHRGGDRPSARCPRCRERCAMKPVEVTQELEAYMVGLLPKRDKVLARMEDEAHREGIPIIDANEGALLRMLVHLAGAKRILEPGTATGYSGTWLLHGPAGAI